MQQALNPYLLARNKSSKSSLKSSKSSSSQIRSSFRAPKKSRLAALNASRGSIGSKHRLIGPAHRTNNQPTDLSLFHHDTDFEIIDDEIVDYENLPNRSDLQELYLEKKEHEKTLSLLQSLTSKFKILEKENEAFRSVSKIQKSQINVLESSMIQSGTPEFKKQVRKSRMIGSLAEKCARSDPIDRQNSLANTLIRPKVKSIKRYSLEPTLPEMMPIQNQPARFIKFTRARNYANSQPISSNRSSVKSNFSKGIKSGSSSRRSSIKSSCPTSVTAATGYLNFELDGVAVHQVHPIHPVPVCSIASSSSLQSSKDSIMTSIFESTEESSLAGNLPQSSTATSLFKTDHSVEEFKVPTSRKVAQHGHLKTVKIRNSNTRRVSYKNKNGKRVYLRTRGVSRTSQSSTSGYTSGEGCSYRHVGLEGTHQVIML